MKKVIFISSLLVAVAVLYSCNKKKEDTLTTTAYLDLPSKNYDYFSGSMINPMAKDSMNRVAALGRVLFYDTHLSLNNSISCGSCHKQDLGFADNVTFSRGFEGRLTGRNSPGINGLNSETSLFWDGREQVLENLIARPITNHVEMGIDDLSTLPAKLSSLPYYSSLFAGAFNDGKITVERISSAVSCFLQTIGMQPNVKVLTVPGANTADLSPLQLRGKMLFDTVYNCGNCHLGNGGGYNGGAGFMDIGLDAVYTDKGFGAISGRKQDEGVFKVPNLTNVALTAPYMHDGRYKTLDEVLEHYSHGIASSPNLSPILKIRNPNVLEDPGTDVLRMNITESDKKAIIAFLGSLTDYKTNTDPKFSNPFKAK